ncbi:MULTISPECIES: VWA domain-containing protein [Asticcacaulis]|uniref:vWA domain-containing protein n=1 Tax=Asticcacaulis TaxID=76890 RepID=UPI001AE7D1D8|nr:MULTISPECIES: VWA domain-containing protein [Asticcacaulis]MBP2158769.1 Ca-activated chloride channel family protein [Asticcacaulis solisilvae]MDR6799815.1 Ca-activated chloride channel family protein [Asticcacaulis sp. BE141]
MRSLLFAGVAATVFVTSLPAGYVYAAVPEEASPVLCTTSAPGYSPGGNTVVVTGVRAAQQSAVANPAAQNAPPPPPPPPPPPVPVSPVPKEARQEYREPPRQMNGVVASDFGAFPDKSTAESLSRVPGVSVNRFAPPPADPDRERYDGEPVAGVMRVAEAPVSTFAVDVDTAAYANVRRMLKDGRKPPEAAVRTEELVNYFRYDYPLPQDKTKPFSITTDVSATPWNARSRLLRIGLRAYDVPNASRPAANLVFLVDVSGSMNSPDKLPLVKQALGMVADNLRPDDRLSIVVYAGRAGLVLKPTSDGKYVRQAMECLTAGGSTAGGQGIALAYATAKASFIRNGINRVILATDGDFNVGTTRDEALVELVKKEMEGGVTLTALGFGTGNYNDSMMEKIADSGNGNYAYIDSALEARKVLDEELQSTLNTVAKDVKIQVEFNPAQVSQYRLIGYENRALAEEDFNNDKVDAGDIGAGHQVTALYEIIPAGAEGWMPERRFAGNTAQAKDPHGDEMVYLKLRYKLPDQDQSRLIEQSLPASLLANAGAPKGDMAFAASVAAYGQLLRGDTNMGSFTLKDARALAGAQSGYVRSEFVELTKLAESANVPR